MKFLLTLIVLLSAANSLGQCVSNASQTCTPLLDLYLPFHGSYQDDWEIPYNNNSSIIDQTLSGLGNAPLALKPVYNLNNILFVDGVKYALTPAGIQAAIDLVSSTGNGCGTIVLPPTTTPVMMSGTGLTMRSCITLSGSGIGSTILQWTSTANAITLASTTKATVRDMTIQFTSGAANSTGIRVTASDAAAAQYNTFENLFFDYPCAGGTCGSGGVPGASTTGAAFFITSTGPSGTDFSLNTINNVTVSAADQAVSCQGCEGDHWQVVAQYMGGTAGHAIFIFSGFNADEVGDLRAESGTGNPSTLSCLSVSGSTNTFRLTCDGGFSTITAIGADPGWNNFDIVTAGPVTLGSVSANSQYRFSSSSNSNNITGGGQLNLQPKTVGTLPSAASNPGTLMYVTDSTAVASEGQTCAGGSTNKAMAFSNGSVWKCF